MAVLTPAQSRARIRELKRQGCEVEVVTLKNGDKVVLKKCPKKKKKKNPEGKNPPTQWIEECARSVKRSSPKVDDPEAVCAANWWRRMTPEKKREIAREYEENPGMPDWRRFS